MLTRDPRTLDFLFSPNRLNVAVSRAIEQMRLINALCRFAEMAREQAS